MESSVPVNDEETAATSSHNITDMSIMNRFDKFLGECLRKQRNVFYSKTFRGFGFTDTVKQVDLIILCINKVLYFITP